MTVAQDTETKIRLVVTDLQGQVKNNSLTGVFGPYIQTLMNPTTNIIPGGSSISNSPFGQIIGHYDWAVENVRNWQSAGQVAAWVQPKAAGLAFITTLNACVASMIAQGVPANPTSLHPGVEGTITLQSQMFAASLGAS